MRIALAVLIASVLVRPLTASQGAYGLSEQEETYVELVAAEQNESPQTVAGLWEHFKTSPQFVDTCARPIAYDVKLNTRTDWPALCNYFRNSLLVLGRVKAMRGELDALSATKEQKDLIRHGDVWIGAPSEAVLLAMGPASHVKKITTAAGAVEMWSYGSSKAIELTDGKVTAIESDK